MKKTFTKVLSLILLSMMSFNAWALSQKEGVYQIGSTQDLVDFVNLVNVDSVLTANAVMTADIDFSSDTLMLGNSTHVYAGSFDGQGHTLTVGYNQNWEDDAAFFRYFSGLVQNLVVKGDVKTSKKFAAGIGAHAYGATIQNCVSLVNITSSIVGDGTHAGILAVADGGATVNNCVFAGSMAGGNTTSCGGIVGWASNKTEINHSLMIADISTNRSSSYILSRNPGNVTAHNCVYKSSWGAEVNTGCTAVSDEELTSGAACFMLNGDQSLVTMYQTIGQDAYPVPFTTSKQVYAAGNLRCDGTPLDGATITYSNDPCQGLPAHEYVLGTCDVCGMSDPDYLQIIDGFYQLSQPEHLLWLIHQVNDLGLSVKVQLTTDIDMSALGDTFQPIGSAEHPFSGTFDGMGHRISNLVLDLPETEGVGFFGFVNGTTTIKNLILDESCSVSAKAYVGLIGETTGGTLVMENLGNEGTVVAYGRNAGGIVGCNMGNSTNYTLIACYSTGIITGENETAAISGWLGAGAKVTGCWSVAEVEGIQEGKYFARHAGDAIFTNCYSAYGVQESIGTFDVADIKSGKLAYLLNGLQTNILWYQTLGEDAQPTTDATHAQVYYGAAVSCDGTPLGGDAYTNTPAGEIPPHDFQDGFCSNCGAAQEDYCEADADGFYHISEAKQLVWFQRLVNAGQISIKAKLDADLDMSEAPEFEPIGTNSYAFRGIFDGQYHVISNLVIDKPEDTGVGMFGYVNGTTIKNLVLDERCSISGHHFVGLVGQSTGGTITLTNLGNRGSVTAAAQNAGGIFGCNSGSSATITCTGCYSTGAVSGGSESGAISGWLNSTGTLINCWSTSVVTNAQSNDTYLARPNSITLTNCWSAGGSQGKTGITAADAATGVLTYKMNGESILNPIWYQNIGEDMYPTWDNTHGIVYVTADGSYADVHDAEGFKALQSSMMNAEYTFCDQAIATVELIDEYRAALDEIKAIDNLPEFAAAFGQITDKRKGLDASVAAYAAYKAEVERVAAYLEEHDDFAGEDRDILLDYIETNEGPSDLYPNGSYEYIWETHTLTTDQIKAETTYVGKLLETAVANGYSQGSDVTRLIANADFSDGSNGWTLSDGSRPATANVEGVGSAAENWNNRFDLNQTITGLTNGVYELTMNGHFRWNADLKGNNYAAMLYANEVLTYLPMEYEDYISVEDAVDGENCHITGDAIDYEMLDDEGELIGYVPMGPVGSAYAYKAGRYLNRLVVNVTDGTLKLGVRCPRQLVTVGTWYGNFHLTYLGDPEDATDQADATLADMIKRAGVILDDYMVDLGNPNAYPNFSETLRADLLTAVEAAGAASDAESKLQAIRTLSDVFQAIYEGKRAYASMVAEAEALQAAAFDLNDSGVIEDTDPVLNDIADAYDQVWTAFTDGTFTTEQAQTEGHQILRQNSLAASQKDGVYQISNMPNLLWFAQVTNVADPTMDACLTADIDFTSQTAMIGNSGSVYSGTFDGGDHTVTVAYDRGSDDAALFRSLSGTVKNLRVSGTISTSKKFAAGIAAHLYAGTVDHCVSDVDITSTISGDGTHAGIVAVSESAGGVVRFCTFAGTMKGSDTNASGGIVGWSTGATTIDHCLMFGDISVGKDNSYTISRNPGNATVTNCFHVATFGSDNSGSILFGKKDEIASGKFAYEYSLAYGADDWFQRLQGDDIDAYPVPFASHGRVYANGDLRCDGKALDDDCTYSNTKTNDIPDHQFHDGVCRNCEQPLPGFMSPGEYDGIAYYWISTPQQLRWFAAKVNSGDTAINGALTADLDMDGFEHICIGKGNQETTGDLSQTFAGRFDGQGHRISNLRINSDLKYQGLIGTVTGGAVIRNVVLDPTCSISGGAYSGLVGCSLGKGEVLFENLGNEGNVTSSGANAGGIIGCCMGNGCHFTIQNCYTTGRVDGLKESGAISGWVGDKAIINNCWSTSEVTGLSGYDTYMLRRASATITNSYCLATRGCTQDGVTNVTDAQLRSGEVTYLLNGGETDPEAIVWFQTIGQDAHPVFTKSHNVVCKNEDGTFYNVPSGIQDGIVAPEVATDAAQPTGVYDLLGRKMQQGAQLKSGLYIINGKKVLVK